MGKRMLDNTKLGIFVIVGLTFMVFSLYMIGRNRNLFGPTFTISASFYNVDGLTTGNNVRFSGIDVGTVQKIEIESDSTIRVLMIIDKGVKKFLKQNAVATIGTDGLMGNKLININSQAGYAPPLESGSIIQTIRPIETDNMLRTLNTTNDNIEIITQNLKSITQKLNNSNSLWNLLADTVIAGDLTKAVASIRVASSHTVNFTREAEGLLQDVKRGEGLAGALVTDTLIFSQLKKSVTNLQQTTKHAQRFAADLDSVMQQVRLGKGTVGELAYDTALSGKLQRSMTQVEEGTTRFNENMEALKHNFLFKPYFRKQEKKKK